MKQLFLFSAATLLSAAGFSQTLISYGDNTVDKTEFLRAYNKNKPAVVDKKKSMRDYLTLYTNFKLKVKAAQELHLDTLSQIRYDIQNFREQVLENYMGDEKGIQNLVDEAALRSATDRHVLYFFVPVAADAKPEDTLKAYNAAKEIFTRMQNGAVNYTETATDVSAKFAPAKFSDAGFTTGFSLPYEFENIVYSTKPGSISAPFRGTKGWFLFKVANERPAAGRWRVAQVLFAYPPNADYPTKLAVKEKADSVYALLQKGLAFGEAAKNFSDDRMTYLAQGELPEFSTGKYDAVFESNVFRLSADNPLSRPFETQYGYHIVKRISQTTIPADRNDATYQFDIRQKVLQDARMSSIKEKFSREIMKTTGFKKSPAVSDADLHRYADSLMKDPSIENTNAQPISKKMIISFKDGSQVKGDEWLKFVRELKGNPEQYKSESNRQLWDRFAAQSTLEYYRRHLEDYNNDFKYQMLEFREGNMLFEIMERNVWGKAGADSIELKKHYNSSKANYKWAPSADVIIINCANEKSAATALKGLNAGMNAVSIAENSNNEVQSDSGRYELSQIMDKNIPVDKTLPFMSEQIKNSDGTIVLIKYLKFYPAGEQRSFGEARGLVINDYQNVLEEKWVAKLREKYPVKINEVLFAAMVK